MLWHFLGRNLFGRRAVDHKSAFPLGSSHEKGADFAFRWDAFPNTVEVRFLSRETHAWPRIDAELDHLKSIIDEKLSKGGGSFPLSPGDDRQIECDNGKRRSECLVVTGTPIV